MSTATSTVAETMARSTTPTTSGPSLSIKEIMTSDSANDPAPTSPDDGFYSAAMFDEVDEEAFLQAQRMAFAEINDAALARALQESEILAATKAAEENRRVRAGTSSAGTTSRASASATATAAPAASRYALVSPSELSGQRLTSTISRREASTSTPSSASSSSPPSRSSPPVARYIPSKSQTTSISTSSATVSSSVSLSASSSHQSRISATASSHRALTAERQPSSRHYAQNPLSAQQQQQQQAKPVIAHARMPSVSSTTKPTTTPYRQAGPTASSSSATIHPSSFYSSTIVATSASTRPIPASSSSSYYSTSASTTDPSSTISKSVSRAASKAPTPATWYPPSVNAGPSNPVSSPPALVVPRSTTELAPISSSAKAAATSAPASARDLRMGLLAVPPKSVEPSVSEPTKLVSRPAPAPRPRQPLMRRKTQDSRRRGRRALSEVDVKWAKAREFLGSNVGRDCKKCREAVDSPGGFPSIPSEPFAHNLLKFIHVACSNAQCGATYCRGCFSSVEGRCRPTESSSSSNSSSPSSSSSSASSSPAPSRKISPSRHPIPLTPAPSCRGSRGCDIKSCCPFASVVAISAILDALDAECVKAAGVCGFKSLASDVREAQAFVDVVVTRSDVKNTKVFEGVLIRALHAVSSWLQLFGKRRAEEDEDEDEDSDEEDDDDDDDDDDEAQGPDPVRDLLYPLITRSLLPSFIHAFLQNRNVGDWLRHSEIYVLILEVLRRMVENGLGKVLDTPIAEHVEEEDEEDGKSSLPYHWRSATLESGGESSTSESDDDSSESDGETETDNTSPDEDDTEDEYEERRRTWNTNDYVNKRTAAAPRPPISVLVTKLEEHLGPLMAFGANVKFPATKSKVHTLCDGISYLLLQQVVAMD